ncbi:MAG TPA: peptidylprolyl isomerase [Gammaproteobacteria bacterium]|nr:peptidylprolyl isomerase [Gammaproteobacteria bacterium]
MAEFHKNRLPPMLSRKPRTSKRLFGAREPVAPPPPQHLVEDGHVVTIDYKLLDETGRVLDTTEGRGLLSYIHGSDQLPRAFQEKLQGRQAGEKVNHQFGASEVYGPRDSANVTELERPLLEGVHEIKPGMRFQTMTDEGLRCVTVLDVDDNVVTVDLSHPLAGQKLLFTATVVSVRPAAREELASGKVL